MTQPQTTTGELVELFYNEYLDLYGDEELARVAAATTINDLLLQREAQARARRGAPSPGLRKTAAA